MGSPPFFFEWASRLLPWLFPISFLILMIGLVWGIGFAPSDYKQGDVYTNVTIVCKLISMQRVYLSQNSLYSCGAYPGFSYFSKNTLTWIYYLTLQ